MFTGPTSRQRLHHRCHLRAGDHRSRRPDNHRKSFRRSHHNCCRWSHPAGIHHRCCDRCCRHRRHRSVLDGSPVLQNHYVYTKLEKRKPLSHNQTKPPGMGACIVLLPFQIFMETWSETFQTPSCPSTLYLFSPLMFTLGHGEYARRPLG